MPLNWLLRRSTNTELHTWQLSRWSRLRMSLLPHCEKFPYEKIRNVECKKKMSVVKLIGAKTSDFCWRMYVLRVYVCVCVSCVVRVIHIESKLPVYHVIIANAAGSSTNQTTILLCMKSVCAALSHPANVFGNFEQRATKDSRDISSQQHQQHQLTLYAMLSSNCFVVFSECVFFSFHL